MINPDIQEYFDFKYVEGELHLYIRKEMVDALGWTDKDLDMSFGGIKRMNSFKGAHISIHPTGKYPISLESIVLRVVGAVGGGAGGRDGRTLRM